MLPDWIKIYSIWNKKQWQFGLSKKIKQLPFYSLPDWVKTYSRWDKKIETVNIFSKEVDMVSIQMIDVGRHNATINKKIVQSEIFLDINH